MDEERPPSIFEVSDLEHVYLDESWHWTAVSTDYVRGVYSLLQSIFSTVKQKGRLNEQDTLSKIIIPAFIYALRFPNDEIWSTVDKIKSCGGQKLMPDLIFGEQILLVEAKRIGVKLFSRTSDAASFSNAIDQGLTYSDHYSVDATVITNGLEWWIFRPPKDKRNFPMGLNYYGLRFRLDEAAYMALHHNNNTQLVYFLAMLHYNSIRGFANHQTKMSRYSTRIIQRRLYEGSPTSNLYFANFSSLPISGRRSGIYWPD